MVGGHIVVAEGGHYVIGRHCTRQKRVDFVSIGARAVGGSSEVRWRFVGGSSEVRRSHIAAGRTLGGGAITIYYYTLV